MSKEEITENNFKLFFIKFFLIFASFIIAEIICFVIIYLVLDLPRGHFFRHPIPIVSSLTYLFYHSLSYSFNFKKDFKLTKVTITSLIIFIILQSMTLFGHYKNTGELGF